MWRWRAALCNGLKPIKNQRPMSATVYEYAKAYVWRWRAALCNGLKPAKNQRSISATVY